MFTLAPSVFPPQFERAGGKRDRNQETHIPLPIIPLHPSLRMAPPLPSMMVGGPHQSRAKKHKAVSSSDTSIAGPSISIRPPQQGPNPAAQQRNATTSVAASARQPEATATRITPSLGAIGSSDNTHSEVQRTHKENEDLCRKVELAIWTVNNQARSAYPSLAMPY